MSRDLYSDARPFGLRVRQTPRSVIVERNGIAVEIGNEELRFVLTALGDAAVGPLPVVTLADGPAALDTCCGHCGSTGPCDAACRARTARDEVGR